MFNMPLLCPQTIALDDSQPRIFPTLSQAETIINVAGISAGDSVFYSGIIDRTMEAAVTGRGACFVPDNMKPWSVTDRNRADAALCFLSQLGTQETIQSLRILRRNLRPGGRMVMWTAPDQCCCASSLRDHFLELARRAGFTSMIVGQLPPEAGRGMVVATGILNK
jgi:hypothetical protein